ncbi:MAG: DUF262 domain-containing HNH endonuclease family protein [Saprospiraceae bacterium]|nr:DUF262 domain-containing HNH endonuclease family protein [Saprospiraceae bacterium]MCF8248751.1 DUF262 domain-containing HNH endonuclease family protein [Saprospiraceae bacterium]MCF8278759.1 DUF262 domain-containing HNH endonuclease family protein [Bacteroidales bacterium]MCF8310559.1 DUF262 domain-containing HNH endonuclease family protein [Saprospiraceae bacterium]MCF8439118.1 DUF262 domain-containing HNH endonuclease family protein [Saprospiraceae bacterium]
MEEPFKPLSLSIRELFGNADALYKIPQYQRPYKWEDEQVDKLWEDITDAFKNGESNYFLGSIITAKPREDEKSAYVDVVDGQQRLTTLMILFCVIRDTYPDLNAGTTEDPFAVDADTISSSIALFGKANRLKLFTHRQHQSDFEALILKGNTAEHRKPYKYQIRTDEEPKYKFLNTANIFRNNLLELGKPQSEELINFLFNQVKIIRIDCKNRDFAIKLFQVLNDRGMDLTAADLIKSYLLEKLYTKYKEDTDTSKLKEEQFIADWREMEQMVKTCEEDISMNDLFIIYEYYTLGQNPKRSLYDELQEAFKGKDPNEVISDIKKFVTTYFKEIYSGKDEVLYSFWYLRWNMYWKSILLAALHTEYVEYHELKSALRRFYYLYWIAGKTLSKIKQASFNMIKWVKEGRPISEIKVELENKLLEDKIISQALESLNSENINNENWIKPLLIMMEYNATDRSKLSFIPLQRDLHLEHILPEKYERFTEWSHIKKEVAAKWLNSAGNLTLLSGAKNIEASNNPFPIKMEVYKGKGKYDDKDDKITAFAISQRIVHEYEKNLYDRQWTEDSMIDRWKWFFAEVGQLLEIDVKEAIEKHKPLVI